MYVKGEGFNFNAMTIALKFIINCESFRLKESFQDTCFGHFFIIISIWHYKGKGLQKSKICLYQVCLSRFVKMHHLA